MLDRYARLSYNETMKRSFYCQEKESNKFWTVEVSANRLTVRFGKVGTDGRETVKEFESNTLAEREAAKLITEKTRKGYKELSEGETIPEKQTPVYRPMCEEMFWEVIARFNWKKAGDDDEVMKPAIKFLASLPEEDIFKFHDIMAQKLYDIDGTAWGKIVEAACDGYLSGDFFLYARCCVVANGKEFYEKVRNDPTQMCGDYEFESLLSFPIEAWAKKMKKDFDDYPHLHAVDYETGANAANWAEE